MIVREQKTSYTSLVWNEDDNLPILKDQLFSNTAQTSFLDLTGATGSVWLFDYHNAIDFDAPDVSGTATITSATSGALEYQFTVAQTDTLAGGTTSLYRGFWKLVWASDELKFRIPTPLQFLKLT